MTPRAPTLATRCWRHLRSAGPASIADLAQAHGVSYESARKVCEALVLRGFAWKVKLRKAAVYAAIGDKAPTDLRGKSPGSRNQARNLGRVWALMMAKKHGVDVWRPKPVQDSHPLAQALRVAP